ncbi:MAG: hypothetical protein AB3N06_06975 [Erythrobacter sp.]
MSFREKSAWVMAAVLLAVGAFYVKLVAVDGVPPQAAAIPFVLFSVVLSVVAQIVLAIASPKEAASPADERERLVIDKAGHFSSYVLAVGVLTGLGHFMLSADGGRMFHIVLTCLILSQLAEYGAQIFLLRRSV